MTRVLGLTHMWHVLLPTSLVDLHLNPLIEICCCGHNGFFEVLHTLAKGSIPTHSLKRVCFVSHGSCTPGPTLDWNRGVTLFPIYFQVSCYSGVAFSVVSIDPMANEILLLDRFS